MTLDFETKPPHSGSGGTARLVLVELVLCSPLRPAQHIALVASCVTDDAEWMALNGADAWQGAGEDWLDAYRQSPISPSEALGCVVCFWHHE